MRASRRFASASGRAREGIVAERAPGGRVAEEARDAYEQLFEEQLALVRVLAQVADVGGIVSIWWRPIRRSIRRKIVLLL